MMTPVQIQIQFLLKTIFAPTHHAVKIFLLTIHALMQLTNTKLHGGVKKHGRQLFCQHTIMYFHGTYYRQKTIVEGPQARQGGRQSAQVSNTSVYIKLASLDKTSLTHVFQLDWTGPVVHSLVILLYFKINKFNVKFNNLDNKSTTQCLVPTESN